VSASENHYRDHLLGTIEHPSGATPRVRITVSNKLPSIMKTLQFTGSFPTKTEAELNLEVAKTCLSEA
jgi:hypothetical protein